MITTGQIKKLLKGNGLRIGDARKTSVWRGAQYAYVVGQQKDTSQRYIVIEAHWPKAQQDEHIETFTDILDNAGIKYGVGLGMVYIHPLQMEDM